VVFVMLAAGFPVALLLAWAIELTPDGIKLDTAENKQPKSLRQRGDLLLYGAVGVVLISWLVSLDWGQETGMPEGAEIRSLVVLPLDNLMNDPQQDYFVEGMHEALIAELSKIEALRVISRTSAMKYLDSNMSVPEIGQELGVDAVIEGSVLRAGETVRITTQLIDARTDRHLWADNFDRKLTDILALYADVTQQIVQSIRVEVTAEEEARFVAPRTVDANAYELYLKGRYLCDRWSPQEMLQGLDILRQAIAADPENVQAQAGLGLCLQYTAFFGYILPLAVAEEAERVAKKAIALDSQLPDGWVSFAGVRYYLNFDMTASELAVQRALELNPSHDKSLVHYSWQLGEAGRFEEAVEYAHKAIALDPFSASVRSTLAQAYYLHRDFDEAKIEYEKMIDMDPSDPSFQFYLGWTLEQLGDLQQAITHHERALELSGRASLYVGAFGHALGLAGRGDEARAILDELVLTEAAGDAEPIHVAMVHIGLGNNDEAIDWLEKGYEARNSHMLYLKHGAQFDALRDDPRFVRLIERMGW